MLIPFNVFELAFGDPEMAVELSIVNFGFPSLVKESDFIDSAKPSSLSVCVPSEVCFTVVVLAAQTGFISTSLHVRSVCSTESSWTSMSEDDSLVVGLQLDKSSGLAARNSKEMSSCW